MSNRRKIAVYTAIAGDYDPLKALPSAWTKAADCIAYLERPVEGTWTWRPLSTAEPDPCRRAKRPKIIPEDLFSEYEYSIWLDGSVVPREGTCPEQLIATALETNNLAVFRHRTRTCIYEEATVCIAAGKDDHETIRRQMARYTAEGYPAGRGLNECTILIRRHVPEITEFCAAWYDEIVRGSRRDQLSFNYVAWKRDLRFHVLKGHIIANPYFTWYYHAGAAWGPPSPVR